VRAPKRKDEDSLEVRNLAKLNPACVACGARNSKGLRLRFSQGPDGASAGWTPTSDWESFQGTIHGGIIGTVLDEAMSKAIIAQELEAFTAELRVRFRGRIAPGDELHVRGWVVERNKRHIRTEATLFTDSGDERAHAWGTFLMPGNSHTI
jgi:acyl-coenzyme A thioesterase PaaI-like protein